MSEISIKQKWAAKIVEICKNSLIYIAFLALLLFAFSKKLDLHVDELWTYNLSNAERPFWPESDVEFVPASQPYLDAHTSNGQFDLSHVWEQQINDGCHPPLYYVLVHAICSLFPNSFSIYYAGVINIFFQMLLLYVLRKILSLMTENASAKLLISCFYILCSGVLSISTFLRMYIMSMFWVTLFTYFVLKSLEHFTRKSYICLSCVAIAGAVTHYHFIVYIVLLSATVGVILLTEKRIGELLKYACSMAVAAITSYFIFPYMIQHMFSGVRGQDSINNLADSNFLKRFARYYNILDNEIYGGCLLLIILVIIALLIYNYAISGKAAKESTMFSKIEKQRYFCLLIPTFLFVIFIFKTTPFIVERYISPIYAVLIVGTFCLLYKCLNATFQKYGLAVFCAINVLILVLSFHNCSWSYLYLDSAERLCNAEQFGETTDAICVYRDFGMITPCFTEISKCKSVTFYNAQNYEDFIVQRDSFGDHIAFFLMNDLEPEFVEKFISDYPEYTIVCDNGQFGFSGSVYLNKKK